MLADIVVMRIDPVNVSELFTCNDCFFTVHSILVKKKIRVRSIRLLNF